MAFVGVLLVTAGCAGSPGGQSVSIVSWQRSVESYVHAYGNDDPTALREVTISDGRKGFSIIGDPIVKSSEDAVGVLLAHRSIGGRPSFVYLVGLVDHGKVADIRLAILSFTGGKPQWDVSAANASALDAYRKYKDSAWRRQFPDRKDPPAAYTNFPGAEDVFTFDAISGRVTAVHAPSGAAWVVGVGASARSG